MASLANLLIVLIGCSAGWVFIIFSARLMAFFLRWKVGVSITFQVAGYCLRDLTVKFKKGTLESISVGEIKLSLVKLGFRFFSWDPKLHLLICDIDIVIRPSEKSINTSRRRSRSANKGKWMELTNMARFLSITMRELVLKTPKAAIEVKELTFDIYKNGGSNPDLNVKLHLVPIAVQIYDPRLDVDPASSYSEGDCLLTGQFRSDVTEKNYAPLICEDFLVACEFCHDREYKLL